MITRIILIVSTLLCMLTNLQSQVKYNNVDTVSSPNRELIDFFNTYVRHRAVGESPEKYWTKNEYHAIHGLDVNELWPNYYTSIAQYGYTILGVSKIDEHTFRIKIMFETEDDSVRILQTIQDFLVDKTTDGYKMANVLNHNLQKQEFVYYKGRYFDYFYPKGTSIAEIPEIEHNELVAKLETFFGRSLPYRFQYVHCNSCEELYKVRGIDYVANMMSAKTTVCGWTFHGNRIMFSAYPGFHKHELLRLIGVFVPNAPLILADGITNLTGGSLGKDVKYHIQKLAPYLATHPEKLDKIEDFWYYDDETNPYFVFHALITNYFLKTKGENAFKEMMLSSQKESIDIPEFLSKYLAIEDVSAFFLDQLEHYSKPENELEFVDFF